MNLHKFKAAWIDYRDEKIGNQSIVNLMLLITLGINIAEIFVPMYVYVIFQNIIPTASQDSLLSSTVIVVAAVVCGSILKKNREELISNNKVKNQYLTTNKVFCDLIESHELGKADIKLSEFNRINRSIADLSDNSIAESLSNLIDAIFGVLFLLILLLICGIPLTLCVIIYLFLFTLFALKGYGTNSELYNTLNKGRKEIEDERNDFIEEVENNLMRIRLDNLDVRFINEFENIEAQRVRRAEMARDSDISFVNKLTSLSKLFSIFVISTGAILVITDLMQSGLLIVGLLLSSRVLRPWRNYLIIRNRESILKNNISNVSHYKNNFLHKSNAKFLDEKSSIKLRVASKNNENKYFIFESLNVGSIYKLDDEIEIGLKSKIVQSICGLSNYYNVYIDEALANSYDCDYIRSNIRYIDLNSPYPRASMLEILTNFRKYKTREAVYWSYISGLDKYTREYSFEYKTIFDNRQEGDEEDTLKIARIISHIIDKPIIIIIDFSLAKYGSSFVEMFYKLIRELSKSTIIITLGGRRAIDSVVDHTIKYNHQIEDSIKSDSRGIEQ